MAMIDMDRFGLIDFRSGFFCFHFKWRLGNDLKLMTDDNNTLETCFETTLHFQDRKKTKSDLLWEVKIESQKSLQNCWIGLKCQSALQSGVPVLHRFVFFNDNDSHPRIDGLKYKDGVRFNRGKMHVFDSSNPMSWYEFEQSSNDFAVFDADDLSLHLWMAIPRARDHWPQDRSMDVNSVFQLDTVPANSVMGNFLQNYSKLLDVVLRSAEDDGDQEEKEVFGETEEDDETCMESDIKLIVANDFGKKRRYNCHRAILTAQSSYFKRQFKRRRRLSTVSSRSRSSITSALALAPVEEESIDKEMTISDVDVTTMEYILRFIYVGSMPEFEEIDQESILKILRAANRFDLEQLKEMCITVLIFRHDQDKDRIDQLREAERSRLDQLKLICTEQLATYALCVGLDDLIKQLPENLQGEIFALAGRKVFECDGITAGQGQGLGKGSF